MAVGLTVLGAATEAFGLLLLVPLIVVAGVVDGSDSSLTDGIASALDTIGIPFTLGWMLAVYVVLVAVRAGIGWARTIVTAKLQYQFVDGLRLRLFDAIARADWTFHLRQRNSDVSHVITSDVNRVQSGTHVVLDLLGRTIATIGYLLVAIRLSVPTTLLALVMLGVIVALLWPTVSRSRRLGAQQTQFGRRSFGDQSEFLEALKIAKSHGNEDRHVTAYRRSVEELRSTVMSHQRVTARSSAVMTTTIAASVAVLAWVAVTRFDTPGPELLALIAVISRLAPMASTGLSRAQQVSNMLPAYGNGLRLLDEALRSAEPRSDDRVGVPFTTALELDNVSFSYSADRRVLDQVSLRVEPGSTVALIGASGAGKTTTVDVVLGLLTPTAGDVLIDGRPLDEYGLATWRRQIAYVPQETFLFHDTLRANVLWACHDEITDDELHSIVDAAALGGVIDRLPNGLDTMVGDRGHRLSGGERQRVALARALARRPSMLVLDEATSALDEANERAVQAAIDNLHGRVAMLVIAHRLSTIRAADEIVVLESGRVVDRGTWAQLSAAGRFAPFD